MNTFSFERLYSEAEEERVKLYIARAIQEIPGNVHSNLKLEDFIQTYASDFPELSGEALNNNAFIYSLFRDQAILERPNNMVLMGQLTFAANRKKWSVDRTQKSEDAKYSSIISPLTTEIRNKHIANLESIGRANKLGIQFTEKPIDVNPSNYVYDFPIMYRLTRSGEEAVLFFNFIGKPDESPTYNDLRLFRSNGQHAAFDVDMFYNYQRNGTQITENLDDAFN